ncbi:MAG: hypothetical protein OSB63_06950 [Planctomycetota bacterium]|nr:hypothetical protein [Planctomycetota bacterium]
MKFPLLAYCVALFASCATPAPTDAWSEGTLVIAITLEQRAQSLATDTSRVFGADNSQREDALSAGRDIENTLRAHAQAWRALFAYSATIENELMTQKLDYAKIEVVAHAFNNLHERLLQTKITENFGLDLDAHRQIVMGMGESSSVGEALVIASYAIDAMCRRLALATEGVEQQLEHLNKRLIELYATDSAPLLQQRQVLLKRQQRYQTVVNPRYDVEFELEQVAAEIAANKSAMSKMLVASNEINKMCLANKLLLQQCVSACYEWGLCHQSLGQSSNAAMQNFRLFEERAEVISQTE